MVRAVNEQESKVAPAVAPRRELRLAAARVVVDRELADVEAALCRADHHLAGELHARGAQVEHLQLVPPDRAHAAVGVAHPRLVEGVEEAGEHRVADVAMQPRHRTGLDVVHPVAHDQIGAVIELGHEARDLVEVVRQVGVAHHDVAPASPCEAAEVCAAVSAPRNVDHAGSGGRRELCAAVLRGVVGDDDLTADPGALDRGERRGDAGLDVLLLVEAGDHDADEEGVLGRGRFGGRKLLDRAHAFGARWRRRLTLETRRRT